MKTFAVVGGGAAGFFAAIAAAERARALGRPLRVLVLEKGPEFLAKVRISGGGRCNVTHARFDPREFARHYPRGGRALIGPFHRFQAQDTVAWFESRGVPLKTESDGRIFPADDRSQSIIGCLLGAARDAGIELRAAAPVNGVERAGDGFRLTLADATTVACDFLLLATGGCRAAVMAHLTESLGHGLEPPVPSLFTFRVEAGWVRALQGIAVPDVALEIPGTRLRDRGPVLLTHWGVSGPAVLRLSAHGARELHAADYTFPLQVNWLPALSADQIARELQARKTSAPARKISRHPIEPLPLRLWAELCAQAGIGPDEIWNQLRRETARALAERLARTRLAVAGKSLNKDEFVTCGGVPLPEVDFKTMESRLCPNLYLAGELLDIDGLTGGFNFQAAWTTGWIAGQSVAERA